MITKDAILFAVGSIIGFQYWHNNENKLKKYIIILLLQHLSALVHSCCASNLDFEFS